MARNMIVRLGVDASSFLQKMIKAGAAAESTGQRIKKSLTSDQRSSLTAQLEKMKTSYQSVRNATEMEDIDLSRPLAKQISDAEKAYHSLLEEAQKTKDALRTALTSSGSKGSAQNIAALRRDLELFRASANEAGAELDRLKQIAAKIGPENMNFASHVGIKKLESEIRQLEMALDETGNEAQRSESFISRMGRAFQNAAGSGRGLSIIPGFLRRIRDSANHSNGGLEKMVRTIRNVSVVSFGLKIARSLFGELESVTRDYISQNAALQAQVNGLKASLGQTLAPAIHLVTNALSYVLPYVVGISNAIGQLMGALFGTGWTAATTGANKLAAATGGATKAQKEMNRQLMSFDQINRMEGHKDTASSGGGGAGSPVAPIEAKTPAWAERLKATFTELFESAEFQAANTGGKIGMVLNTAIGEATSALANVDFFGAGSVLAANFNSMISAIDWNTAGQLMGMALVALPSVAIGFIQSADWPLVGQSVSQFLMSSLGTVSERIRSVDWLQVGTALGMFIANVDYVGIAQSLGSALGVAIGAIGATLWGMIREPWQEFGKNLSSNMELFGGDAVAGFFYTLGQGVANIGTWLWDNFCKPIIDGVKEGFGIHSPSKVFGEIGTNCVNSLADRFGEGVVNILAKISDLKSRVTNAAQTLKDAFSFEWRLPHLRLPHLSVQWDPVDNVLAQFFGVTAFPRLNVDWYAKGFITNGTSILNGIGIGERGREALLPLDSNDGWKDEIAQRIAMILQSRDGGDVNATINLVLDLETLTSYFIKGLRRRCRAGTTTF